MPGRINENIKSIRELKNYSQQHMALRLNITQSGYSKIEKGGSGVSLEKLEEIASIFEMDLRDIIGFESSLFLKASSQKASAGAFYPDLEQLYRDKIALLEKLLDKTEKELKKYKDKYGCL